MRLPLASLLAAALLIPSTAAERKSPAAPAPEAVAAGSVYTPMRRETAQVHQLAISPIAGLQQPLELTLFSRQGKVAGGYALIAGGAPIPLKIVCEPAGRHGIFDAKSGTEIEYPASLFQRYGYHKEDFRAIRNRYSKGELIAKRFDDPPALQWSNGALNGTVDVILNEGKEEQPLRLTIAATVKDGTISGSSTSWTYEFNDLSYGSEGAKVKGIVQGKLRPDFWQAKPDMTLPAGIQWPNVHGPTGGMAAPPSDAKLITDITKARLAWVSEEIMAGSKGDRNKTEFGVGALVSNDLDGGGFASPVIADGRVYLTYHLPDFDRIIGCPEWQNSILRIRGAPLGNDACGFWRQVVLCCDAATGKTIWRTDWTFNAKELQDEKQEKGRTPVISDGIVAVRINGNLIGFDATTGERRWSTKVGTSGVYWSCEESPTVIDGVFVIGTDSDGATGLMGVDPKTGKELWRQTRVRGYNAIPQAITLEGKTWIISACGASLRRGAGSVSAESVAAMGSNPEFRRLVLMDPKTGVIRWEDKTVGHNLNTILVWQDIACVVTNPDAYERGDEKGSAMKPERLPWIGGYRITSTGAQRLWENKDVANDAGRHTPLATTGCFIFDSRETGFTAVDAATGKLIGKAGHLTDIGETDHNWSWCVAQGDQIVTNGLLRFSLTGGQLKQLPGQLKVPCAAGYVCPIKPALVDGRLFMRTKHQLVCYDLRAR